MMKINKLKHLELTDSSRFQEDINLSYLSLDQALKVLKEMKIIRRAEEEIAQMVKRGEVVCPCHFAIGQEAPAAAISQFLRKTDRIFGAHRSHAHYLACGGSVKSLFSEVLGRSTGASKGMGGSMHLYGAEFGFGGSVPIVGGTVPIAVGAAISAKFDRRGDISVAYFGDGAIEEGIVHESLNLSSIMNLPILFVVENNLYSSHLDIKLRQPGDRVARFAEANNIKTEVADGNNVNEISQKSKKLIEYSRQLKGPTFLEAVTFRWMGHVGPDENIDVGIRRSQKEIDEWKKRDPILRLQKAIIKTGCNLSTIDKINLSVEKMISEAKKYAYNQPFPNKEDLLNFVYSSTKES